MYTALQVQEDFSLAHVNFTGRPEDYPMQYELWDGEMLVHLFAYGMQDGSYTATMVITHVDDPLHVVQVTCRRNMDANRDAEFIRIFDELTMWVAGHLNRLSGGISNNVKLVKLREEDSDPKGTLIPRDAMGYF